MKTILLAVPAVLGFCLGCAGTLHGGGVVQACDESSLRTALLGGGQVTFACDGTISLSEPLVIDANTSIDASGHQVVLNGQGATRVMVVKPGAVLHLAQVAIANGRSTEGAGIWSQDATVILDQCRLVGNIAQGLPGQGSHVGGDGRGGALFATGSLVQMNDCLFTNNAAMGGQGGTNVYVGAEGGRGMGGAVYVADGSCLMSGSYFVSNSVAGGMGGAAKVGGEGGDALGGAVFFASDAVSVTTTEFEGCKARGGNGGVGSLQAGPGRAGWGGAVHVAGGALNMSASTMRSCEAAGVPMDPPCGGGLSSLGTVVLLNTTIAANRAVLQGTGNSLGGGLYNRGFMTVEFCTMTSNQAAGPQRVNGANVHNEGGYLALRATVVADGLGQPGIHGPIVDQGYNVCSDFTVTFSESTSRKGLDPKLGPLGPNGGRVWTCLPAADSPLLDQVPLVASPATDGRGFARPRGGGADIGAVEGSVLAPILEAAFVPALVRVGQPTYLQISVRNPNGFPLRSLTLQGSLSNDWVVSMTPPVNGDCQGSVLAAAGAKLVSITVPSLPAGGQCTHEIPVQTAREVDGVFALAGSTNANVAGFFPSPVQANVQVASSPMAVTLPFRRLADGSWELHGMANPGGLPVRAYFEWSLDASLSQRTSLQRLEGGETNVQVVGNLQGLPMGSQWRCRFAVSDDFAAGMGKTVLLATPSARGGTMARFDGQADGTWVRQGFTNVTRGFTMEFWARPSAVTALPSEAAGGVSYAWPWRFALYPSEGARRYGAGHVGVGVSVGVNGVSVVEHGNNMLSPVLVHPVKLEGWHHIAVVYGAEARPQLFVDGEFAGFGLATDYIQHPSIELSTTVDDLVAGLGHYSGDLEEVRVWNRPLGQDELIGLMARTAGGQETGLEACLHLDEGTGVAIADATGHGYDGEMQTDVEWRPSDAPFGQPAVVTLGRAEATESQAQLRCQLNPQGIAGRVHGEWGLGSVFNHESPSQEVLSTEASQRFVFPVSGLRPGLLYDWRPVLESSRGTYRGEQQSFFTRYPAGAGLGVEFDGASASIRAGAKFTGILNTFTMEFWARPTEARAEEVAQSNAQVDLSLQRFVFYPTYGPSVYGESDAVAGISLGTNGVSVFEHSATDRICVVNYSVPIFDSVHVAVVVTAGQAAVYLNGELVKRGNFVSRRLHPSADLGLSLGATKGAFAGELDEVRVWKVARTAGEIAATMPARLLGNETGLVMNYSFEGGSGETVPDEAASAWPGQVMGTVRWTPSCAEVDGPSIESWSLRLSQEGQAEASAAVNPAGHACSAHFEWGNEPGFGNTTPAQDLGNGHEAVSLQALLPPLPPGSNLSARLVITFGDRYRLGSVRTVTSGWPGAGSALQFNGITTRVQASANFPDVTNDFTMELWLKATDWITLLPANPNNVEFTTGQRFVLEPTQGTAVYGNQHVGVGLSAGRNGLSLIEHGANWMPIRITCTVDLSEWTHVAVVYRQRSSALYLNGDLMATGPAGPNIVHPASDLGWNSLNGSGGCFKGMVDEVRIWRAARSAEQIRANMHRALTGAEPDLVRYWPMNEAAGAQIHNSGARVDEAVAYSAAWVASDAPVGRGYVLPEIISGLQEGHVDVGFSGCGNGAGGQVQLEWGADSALGSASAAVTISPDDDANGATVRIADPGSGLLCYRTVIMSGAARFPGPLQKLVFAKSDRRAALEFDGVAGGVSVDQPPFASLGTNFTVEFWCQPAGSRDTTQEGTWSVLAPGIQQCAIYPRHGELAYGKGYVTAGVSVGSNGVSVLLYGNALFMSVLVHQQDLGGWNHVAVSYSNALPRLFLNGVLVRSGQVVNNVRIHPGADLGGGPDVEGSRMHYRGQLDEVRVWDRALTETDLQSWLHTPLDQPPPGLVWHLQLEEGWGSATRDAVDSSRLGRLSSGVQWAISGAPVFNPQRWTRLADGGVHWQFPAVPLAPKVVQESADLVTWVPVLTNNASANGIFEWNTPNPAPQSHRFYRLMTPQ